MPGPISISGDADLGLLLKRIADDIVNAGAFLRLHKKLEERFASHEQEVNSSPAFWTFTAAAVRDAGLLCLARIYDQRQGALSLHTLLITIRKHPELFSDEAVKTRVNAHYAGHMRPGSHAINSADLQAHIALVHSKEPLVKKVILWRNNLGAHCASEVILRGRFPEGGLPSREDSFQLLERAFSIFNHYSMLFHATTTSTNIVGEENHDFVFDLLRVGLKNHQDDRLKRFDRGIENLPST